MVGLYAGFIENFLEDDGLIISFELNSFYILILVFFDYVVFETLLEVLVMQLNHITITIERFMNISNLIYDQKGKNVRSRGCTNKYLGTISVYDSGSYTSFQIECLQNLCNNDTPNAEIKTIY
jgi:hypothetical protein